MNPKYLHKHGIPKVFSFKTIISVFILLSIGQTLQAQSVDREELGKSSASQILFINYEGPYARIDEAEDIRNIGFQLGRAVKEGNLRPGSLNRYFAIHTFSDVAQEQLNADIFGLGVDTGVDHIRNLRRILQGYLEGAYDYSPSDAALLSEFITIYNAVYRGNWDYLSKRYREAVTRELSPEKVGLSIRFDEWPGRSLILVPLATGKSGTLSAVDTSSITEGEVVDTLRQEQDMGIEQRKEMVDLKEREAEEERQSATLKREAIAEEEAKIEEERKALEAKKEQLSKEEESTAVPPAGTRAEAAPPPSVTASPPEKAQEGSETPKEESLEVEKAEIEKQEEELRQREEELQEMREEAAETEQRAEAKEAEAKADREEIAQDQQSLINAQDDQEIRVAGVPGIRLLAPQSPLGKAVLLDPATGAELHASVLDTINGRTLTVLDGNIIAIAGQASASGAIRLIILDPESLDMLKQGEDDIHPNSLLWIKGSDIYALVHQDSSAYLGRFGTDLTQKARSIITVHNFASIRFSNGVVLTQREDGSALVLDALDLSEQD